MSLAVRLIIPDTTAVSARQALRQAGLTDLTDIRREMCWSFDVDDSSVPERVAERLIASDVLVNYNKHRARWWLGSLEGDPAALPQPDSAEPEGRLLVGDRDDPEPARMQRILTTRLGFSGLEVLRRATLWSISVLAGADVAQATQDAARLLLVNPHGQVAQLITAGPSAQGDVRRAGP